MTRTRTLLLGSTVIAGLLQLAAPSPARAAEVLPGGALDITLSGFGRFRVHGGRLDDQYNVRALSSGLDFSNNYELHLVAKGRHDTTGLEYGAAMYFEADTNHLEDTDEEWLFLRGAFGEFRFGDVDGAVEESSVGAYTVAAATGGIDGDVISALAIDTVRPSITDDATKVRYYTPALGGFQLGVSYAPNVAVINDGLGNGDSLASRRLEAGDVVEAALVYGGGLAGLGLQASAVGSWGHVATPALLNGSDTYWTYYGGLAASALGLKLAGGYGEEDVGGLRRRYANAGVGASLGRVDLSLTAGKVLGSSGYAADKPWIAVLGADVALMPGLALMGEVAYFDNDLSRGAQAAGGDAGFSWLATLQLAF